MPKAEKQNKAIKVVNKPEARQNEKKQKTEKHEKKYEYSYATDNILKFPSQGWYQQEPPPPPPDYSAYGGVPQPKPFLRPRA